MAHLVCRAYYDNEYRGDEFSPSHFVLELDASTIRSIKYKIENVKKWANEGGGLFKADFEFYDGMWVRWDEKLDDVAQEEFQIFENFELEFPEGVLEEPDGLCLYQIEIYHDCDFRFVCYGKWDNEKIYTCILNIDDLTEKIK